VDFSENPDHRLIREAVRETCARFPDEYWAELDALQTHGGFGYASEYHVERYWREARLLRIAPIPQEMILNYLAEHVLGLPRSY
jgi:hypothetical protein